jgi:hypothetical protein
MKHIYMYIQWNLVNPDTLLPRKIIWINDHPAQEFFTYIGTSLMPMKDCKT